MKKQILLLFTCLTVIVSISMAQTTIPDGGDINAAVAAASDGDVLELVDGGIYTTEGIVIDKGITIKAVDGADVRPAIISEGSILFTFGEMKTPYGLKLQGIELAANVYNSNICELLRNDSITYIIFSDVIAHDFGGSIIQARDGAERPHPIASLDSLVVENSYFYDSNCEYKRGTFYLDRDDVATRYIKLFNSTFDGFYKKFLDCGHPNFQKTVIIDHVNVVREDPLDGTRDDDLVEIKGDSLQESSITISNSIFGHQLGAKLFDFTQTPTAIIDSIYNCMLFDIDTAGTTYNEWIYADYTFADPLFSHDSVNSMYLTTGSPALTASSTGGPIGDLRWTVLPDPASLLDLDFSAEGQFLRPMFRPDHYSYTAVFPFPIDTFDIVASTNFKDAAVSGAGEIILVAGADAITKDIVVTNGTSTKTYSITMSRLPGGTDATLSNLMVRNENDTLDLSPAFDAATMVYTLNMPSGSPDTVYVEPVATDETASVELADDGVVSLVDGPASVEVIVTAEDGLTTNTYTVDIKICGNGTDASLSTVTVDGALLAGFDAATLTYNIELPEGTTSVPVIDALPTDDEAEIVITQASDVNGSATVDVASTDCNNSSTYTFNFSVVSDINNVIANTLYLYPNPAMSAVTINTNTVITYIEIYNVIGEKIKTTLVNSSNGEYFVNISDLASGVYLIRAYSENISVGYVKFSKK